MRYGPQRQRLPARAVGRQPLPELAGRRRRPGEAVASSGSTTTGWTTPGPTSTRAWSASTRSTTRSRWAPGGTTWATRRQGLRLPGVRTDHSDGSFDVDYDIPLAFYDCRLDDGVTPHKDIHDAASSRRPEPATHPEWWGKTFFKHFPNHGFVGRHLHRQRHGLPGAGGQAAQVPLPLPGRLDRPDLRVQADELDAGPEDRGRRWATRRRAAGAVPHPGRPAVHEVHPDRLRRRPAAVPDHPRLLRAVAGQAARGHRRLHQVPGRHARPRRATSSTSPT